MLKRISAIARTSPRMKAWKAATLLKKRDSGTGSEFCEIFKNIYFTEHLPVTVKSHNY